MSGLRSLLARALVGTAGRPFPWLAGVALALGGVGAVVPPAIPLEAEVRAPLRGPDLLQIDAVLAHRSPELGQALRHRIVETILTESSAARLDPLFVLGLIEVESAFDGVAVSHAGARGLMQLRPGTLEYLAGLEGLRLPAEEIWRDPALQVRLGIRYLERLERRFRSLDLALMAYNAGPGKLRASLAMGEVERFRSYVQAVRRRHQRFRHGALPVPTSALAQAPTHPEPSTLR